MKNRLLCILRYIFQFERIMIQPSQEQQTIIDVLRSYQNVMVDACAGSGKSTTVLSAAAQLTDREFIQLTFNRSLSAEISERVAKYQLPNIQVFTYHSLLVHYYHAQGYTDQEMRQVVMANSPPIHELPKMDVLVIDETQDMSMLYFRFLVKFCKDAGRKIQILVLGDEQQALYGFNGSDTRFLTQANQIWQDLPLLHKTTWHECVLKTSYRATLSMARFVNEIMMGRTKMLSTGRVQSPVVYVRQTNVNIANMIVKNICGLLDMTFYPKETSTAAQYRRRRRPGPGASYAEQDIFILAQSVKHTNSTVALIEALLTYNGISCYLPSSDEVEMDERVTAHKVVFSSFCRSKGRQRKIVFVIGFDQTHFRFKSDLDQSEWIECQNDLYVACTRASEHLCVCESIGPSVFHQPLRFLKKTEEEIRNHEMVRYTGMIRGELEAIPPPKQNPLKNTSPTELIRFIHDSVLESIEKKVKGMFVKRHLDEIKEDEEEMDPFAFPAECMGFLQGAEGAIEEAIEEAVEDDDRRMYMLDIPSVVLVDPAIQMYEDVSAINGIVIPYMYFDRSNPNYMRDDLHYFAKGLKQKYPYLFDRAQSVPSPLVTIPDYLCAGTVLSAISDKLLFRIQNLDCTDYDWLEPDIIEQCMDRLQYIFDNEPRVPCADDFLESTETITNRTKREIQRSKQTDRENMSLLHFHSDQDIIEHTFITQGEMDPRYARIDKAMETMLPGFKVRFTARLDYIHNGHIWELKCCNDLVFGHYLQVIIYAWLWRMTDAEREEYDDVYETDDCVFHLYNIRTNEHYELCATTEELAFVVGVLLRGKYQKDAPPLDDQFVETCRAYVQNGI